MSFFTLAHTSDWHATSLARVRPGDLLNKRVLGWLSWVHRRRHMHRPEILRALFDDVRRQAPDHVAVTGDLTNISLVREFEAAAALLGELGPPEWVTLVPGNHDAYVRVPRAVAWDLWSHYIASDDAPEFARSASSAGAAARAAPVAINFPTVRIRGPIALVGVCTAVPSPPGFASGRCGKEQLVALEAILEKLRDQELCRVVLTHHPATDAGYTPRRRLSDATELRAVLARVGADLVLHGHGHRRQIVRLAGPDGDIPCVGVRSASHAPEPEERRSQYHVFRIEPRGTARPRIALATRGYDAATATFADEGSLDL